MQRGFLCAFLLFFCLGCGFDAREKELKKKEELINEKQKDLLLWEQRLTLKEQDLNARKQKLDSTGGVIDSAALDAVKGKWLVKMRCIETSCDGSAIGDTKTEQWSMTVDNENIVVNAYADDKLSRIYNGKLKQQQFLLVDKQEALESLIQISLRFSGAGNKRMEGTREIIQKNCKIVYSLVAERLPQ